MKTRNGILLVLFALMTLAGTAQNTDSRFGIELSAGPSFAIQELGDADLNTGLGLEGILHFRLLPHTGVYAGWGWNNFSADNSFAGTNTDFEETGYVFGLQFKQPFVSSSIAWYLRAGGLYNHIEMENEEGIITGDTGHGFGWQLSTGIDLPLGDSWSLTPGLKFNSLSREMDYNSLTTDLDLRYVTIRLEVLKKQIDPHFMFNSLNVLSELIARDSAKAQRFIDEFAHIFRYVLETIEKPVVTVDEEIRFVRSYMFLQKMRYGNHLVFNVNLPASLLDWYLPPLSLQVVLENAIKHNLISPEQPLKIDISAKNSNLVITNNIQLKLDSGTHTRLGQKNLFKRYKLICSKIPLFQVGSLQYIVTLPLINREEDECNYN